MGAALRAGFDEGCMTANRIHLVADLRCGSLLPFRHGEPGQAPLPVEIITQIDFLLH